MVCLFCNRGAALKPNITQSEGRGTLFYEPRRAGKAKRARHRDRAPVGGHGATRLCPPYGINAIAPDIASLIRATGYMLPGFMNKTSTSTPSTCAMRPRLSMVGFALPRSIALT